ncbi:hypothetical protein BC937DRAFT_87824 [Endogone sp. FLAS-F59071]|nr:hypothetical protein BC937DRAFT_87824 [Endogone sp. FLAS-F59071]|eukprot:RUS22683.1 hypothetical protein BC937DRAFT_87824 [Endogone sp. FLAS-F59071]
MSSSIGANCTELKARYDNCFHKWYSEKFLKGSMETECEDLFKEYKACVMVEKKDAVDRISIDAEHGRRRVSRDQ